MRINYLTNTDTFFLLVTCLFSENIPFCIFLVCFFFNNEGYSAQDCKLHAQIAHNLITCELYMRHEHVGHTSVDLVQWLVGWKRVPRICGWGWSLQKCRPLLELHLHGSSPSLSLAFTACHVLSPLKAGNVTGIMSLTESMYN